jgi:mRNA export factor
MSLFGKITPTEPKDVELQQVQPDAVSSLAWSPSADLLAVASWNSEVRVFEVGAGGQNQGRAQYAHEGPVLCVQWSKDGSKIVSGGADNAGRIYDVATGTASQFAAHDSAVRCIRWLDVPGSPMVVTGSWDKVRSACRSTDSRSKRLTCIILQTLRYWDMRQPTPVATVQLPERCYSAMLTFCVFDPTLSLTPASHSDRRYVSAYGRGNRRSTHFDLQP